MSDLPNLRNYTTNVPVEKSIFEIESILAKFGATAILKEYLSDGSIHALSFKIKIEGGEIPFKIPMDVNAVAQYRADSFKTRQKKDNARKDLETARRIGWRILKDWIHAQLSIVQLQLVSPIEIFLPYAYDYVEEKTLAQKFIESRFKGLVLEK